MAGRATCESCVRGYHVYKSIWTAEIGETLVTKPEFGNSHDPYALAVVDNNNIIVGHLPRNIAALCHLFLRGNETIIVQITGKRRFSADLPQGGLELPCSLIFDGETKDILKVKKLLCAAPTLPVEVSDKQDKNKALSESCLLQHHHGQLQESHRKNKQKLISPFVMKQKMLMIKATAVCG